MEKLKVLIVDDSMVYRNILKRAVEDTEMGSVLNTAPNGEIALEWLSQKEFDVVLLDIFMPGLSGIEVLKIIKKTYPNIGVVMVSSEEAGDANVTLKALEMGALDFILKPTGNNAKTNAETMKNIIKAVFAQLIVNRNINKTINKSIEAPIKNPEGNIYKREYFNKADLILIASSTGGPAALKTLFSSINGKINKPVLIVQHMPAQFTKSLAKSLNEGSKLFIKEGEMGELLRNGCAFIAPGGFHMRVTSIESGEKVITIDKSEYVNGVRPAADILFKSVAKEYKQKNILVIILTGMGEDGTEGVRELKKNCNCYCVTQSEESCVVYGMPKSICEEGLSNETVHIKDIGSKIIKFA